MTAHNSPDITTTAGGVSDVATAAPTRRVGPRKVFASLWLFAILSYLYCDLLGSHDADYMRDILDGTGAVKLGQSELLGAAILMTIPIAATLITRIASHRFARWYSVIAGAVMTVVQVVTLFVGTSTMYYMYFSALEIAATVAIVWVALTKWKVDA